MTDLPSLPFTEIIFDFDGVILDSATLKTRAFAEVYRDEPDELVEGVTAYQDAHGGVGRREKFEHFERAVFGREPTPGRIDALCERFAGIVDEGMRRARFIPGIIPLLDRLRGRLDMHVVTGMPQDDLVRTCAERSLTDYFDTLIGTPTTKVEAFTDILGRSGLEPEDFLAVGDSTTEYDAAKRLGMAFLAIVPPDAQDRFPPELCRLADFSDLDHSLRRMVEASTGRRRSAGMAWDADPPKDG